MKETPSPPHTVTAQLRCAGRLQANTVVVHGGTSDACVAVTVGRSLIYMHSRATTERLGLIWKRRTDPSLTTAAGTDADGRTRDTPGSS
jgi:hypothetical protein